VDYWAYLSDHGNKSLTLASSDTDKHTRSEVPLEVCCKRTQYSTNEHNSSCDEEHNATTHCYGYWHSNQVANAPNYH
jgi:hypothetical protein